MTDQCALDRTSAARIARVDPELGPVTRSVPPGANEHDELHDVSWTPGRQCSLAYRVASAPPRARFVAVEIDLDGWSQRDLDADPSLPGLSQVLDHEWVRRLLGSTLGETIQETRIDPVRYRPGSRCVVRYTTRLGAGESRTWYAKVFPVGTFSSIGPLAESLAGSPEAAALMPRLAGVWPENQALLFDAAPGPSVSSLLGDPDLSTVHRARLIRRLGTLLGALHGCRDVTAPHWSAMDQLAGIRDAIAAVAAADPEVARVVRRLLIELEGLVPLESAPVLSHGSFRPGQVILCLDQRLVFVDIDGVCLSSRARDLATALAHMFWLGVRRPGASMPLLACEKALVAGYGQGGAAVDPTSLLWWRATALLQVAVRRYRRLETQAWPLVPALVDAASDVVATLTSQATARLRADLLDRESMAIVLRAAAPGRIAAAQTLRIETAETMSVTPGRRTVVRYRVHGLRDEEPLMVVGKAFTQPARARLLHAHLEMLHGGPLGEGRLRVPEPLGMPPGQRLVFYRHCDGRPLSEFSDPVRTEDGVRSAAQWLARLHCSGVALAREFSLAREGETTSSWAALVGNAYPDLAGAARALACGWVAAARVSSVGPKVPIHKDFHAGHVLVGNEISVVDLDEARLGDPAFDLAHFCVYLRTTHGDEPGLAGAFLGEYSRATGWRDAGSYRPYCAYTWLKIARQQTTGSGPFRTLPAPMRRTAVEEALDEGARCLNP